MVKSIVMHSRSSSAFRRGLLTKAVHQSTRRAGTAAYFGVAVGLGLVASFTLFGSQANSKAPQLTPTGFSPTTITSAEDIKNRNPDTKLITLKIPPHLLPPSELFTSIWSVFIKDDDIQVERPYTPLEGVDANGNMKFWIKRYPKGEVGRWLHSKVVGDTVELRGPLKTWNWQEDVWDEVIMISGGTGITPFYQLFHNVIRHSSSNTRFTLLHASRSLQDLPPSSMLEPLKAYSASHPDRFTLRLFVDTANLELPPQVKVGQFDKGIIERELGSRQKQPWWRPFKNSKTESKTRRRLFLVCGPPGMVAAIAGPYGRNLAQGAVGGILGELGFTSNEVYKL